jgi:hypothetical protein
VSNFGIVAICLALLFVGGVMILAGMSGCEAPSIDLFGATERAELEWKAAREETRQEEFRALAAKYRAEETLLDWEGRAFYLSVAMGLLFPYLIWGSIVLGVVVGGVIAVALVANRWPRPRVVNIQPGPALHRPMVAIETEE